MLMANTPWRAKTARLAAAIASFFSRTFRSIVMTLMTALLASQSSSSMSTTCRSSPHDIAMARLPHAGTDEHARSEAAKTRAQSPHVTPRRHALDVEVRAPHTAVPATMASKQNSQRGGDDAGHVADAHAHRPHAPGLRQRPRYCWTMSRMPAATLSSCIGVSSVMAASRPRSARRPSTCHVDAGWQAETESPAPPPRRRPARPDPGSAGAATRATARRRARSTRGTRPSSTRRDG